MLQKEFHLVTLCYLHPVRFSCLRVSRRNNPTPCRLAPPDLFLLCSLSLAGSFVPVIRRKGYTCKLHWLLSGGELTHNLRPVIPTYRMEAQTTYNLGTGGLCLPVATHHLAWCWPSNYGDIARERLCRVYITNADRLRLAN